MSGAAETLIAVLRHGGAAGRGARSHRRARFRWRSRRGTCGISVTAAPKILRAVAFVVRDRDWGTYAPVIADLEVTEGPDAFTVAYTAVCRGPSVLRYRARIEGRADGALRFAAEAVPEGDFETNRCGFVVLHPAAAAGAAVTVEHCDGSREATAFPELIDPWRPFLSIREITHRAGGLEVTCRLEGEEFEMEDQRNWSDASFKTYGRPLELPWPFVLPAGVPIAQSVAVSVRRLQAPRRRRGRRRNRSWSRSAGRPGRASRRSGWSSRRRRCRRRWRRSTGWRRSGRSGCSAPSTRRPATVRPRSQPSGACSRRSRRRPSTRMRRRGRGRSRGGARGRRARRG